MKSSRKEFILKAHQEACTEWKTNIEKEFPKLFKETKLEVGEWYKGYLGNISFICKPDKNNKIKSYGLSDNLEWYDDRNELFFWGRMHEIHNWKLMTHKEAETALISECKKLGIWEVPVECLFSKTNWNNRGALTSGLGRDGLWSTYGMVFKDGVFAKSLRKQMTIEQVEETYDIKVIN